ncbi:hypothetical protein GCM10010109_35740 [Actinoplanes campanulatus]|nr:hypothetical protein GCM10010109_35740 [Actinoplanes campanulatus]GID35576.1 hypothetical protein Aca09nite_20820 [Actinoplanes campanulatus]
MSDFRRLLRGATGIKRNHAPGATDGAAGSSARLAGRHDRNHPPGATGVTAGSDAPVAWQAQSATTHPERAVANAGVSNRSTPGGRGRGRSWQ